MLTQLKNAQSRGHSEVVLPFSNMKFQIANVLKSKNFIGEVEKKKTIGKNKSSEINVLTLNLKYENGEGKITGTKMISKPSRRMYARKGDMKPVKNGYGIAVVSTSRGIMSDEEARRAGVGGEVLFEMW